jgi:hypothetical protein
MQYLKRNTKFSILAFLIIVLSITISIFTLAKTEVYFSLYDGPQKAIIKNINQAEAFINIAMYVFTGSYNWTFSANNRNDENLMIIDNPEIIEIFQNQFVNLWNNKYSLERTRQLYKIAKVDFLPTSPTSAQTGPKVINIDSASPEEFTSILQISESLAWKIITLREKLGGFKEPQDLTKLPELTNLDWKEWEEESIIFSIEKI